MTTRYLLLSSKNTSHRVSRATVSVCVFANFEVFDPLFCAALQVHVRFPSNYDIK
jgi:hypothetical protein